MPSCGLAGVYGPWHFASGRPPSAPAGPRQRYYGTLRFVTCTDSVAAARSKVAEGEMLRAITRTVLVVQAAASSSTKRVEEASAASARSPCRQPGTVTSSRRVAPGAKFGRSQAASAARRYSPDGPPCRSAGRETGVPDPAIVQ
jgi:hypothetical protein